MNLLFSVQLRPDTAETDVMVAPSQKKRATTATLTKPAWGNQRNDPWDEWPDMLLGIGGSGDASVRSSLAALKLSHRGCS